MARIRSVKPEFWTNSTTGHLSGAATKLYLGLHNHSDDYGVGRYEPDELRVKILPYEKGGLRTLERAVDELEQAGSEENPYGLVVRFEVDRKRYYWLAYFSKHQKVDRPSNPTIDGWTALSTPLDYADSASPRESSASTRDRAAGDRSGEDRRGNNHVDLSDRPVTDIEKVWNAYREHHPRASGTPQRRALIKRRLEHYDAGTLVAAISGNHADPYCNGENREQRQYHSLDLILRDADHIEKYAALATSSNGKRELTAADFDEMARRRAETPGWREPTAEEYDRFRVVSTEENA